MASRIGPRVLAAIAITIYFTTVNAKSVVSPRKRASPPDVCEDNAPNCDEYVLSDLCTNPIYTDWVFRYCKLSCSLCGVTDPVQSTTQQATAAPTIGATTSAVDPSCQDKINNCNEYQIDTCTNPAFIDWAKEHCSHFCGFCVGVTTTPTPTTTETPHPDGLVCFDRIDCESYNIKDACCGDYEPWARENCARFCKFCDPVITVAPVCDDTDSKCGQYGHDLCTNPKFDRFVREHCAGTCRICEQPEYIPECAQSPSVSITTTMAPLTSLAPGVCADLIDCAGYDIRTSCCSPYEEWARQNCPKHCRFCFPAVPEIPLCHDIDDKCDQYGDDLCTNPSYDRFIHEKCAGFCSVCTRPVYIPSCANTTAPPITTPDCFQDSSYYPQGSSWDTSDCLNHCTCVDGFTNNIKCDAILCPSPVPNCDLVHIPGHCCPVLHNCRPET